MDAPPDPLDLQDFPELVERTVFPETTVALERAESLRLLPTICPEDASNARLDVPELPDLVDNLDPEDSLETPDDVCLQ